MKVLQFLCLVSLLGCAGTRLEKWTPAERQVIVSSPVCDACDEPYDWQKEEAMSVVEQRCGKPSTNVIEEGSQLSGNYQHIANASFARTKWYWVVKCD